jgi:hypothetical protein
MMLFAQKSHVSPKPYGRHLYSYFQLKSFFSILLLLFVSKIIDPYIYIDCMKMNLLVILLDTLQPVLLSYSLCCAFFFVKLSFSMGTMKIMESCFVTLH